MTITYEERLRWLDRHSKSLVLSILKREEVDLSGPIIDITDTLYDYAVNHGIDGDDAAEWAMQWDSVVAE
jgi:hypothetical protein